MAKGSSNKPARRKARNIQGLRNMQLAAGGVAIWGPDLLDRLPHGFEGLKAGQGKKWWDNKRVVIILAAIIFTIQSDKLSWRLWSIPLTALLTLAVTQHKVTYGGAEEAELLVEDYA